MPITVADANAVASVLRDPQFCGYPPEQVALPSMPQRAAMASWLLSMHWQLGPAEIRKRFFTYGADAPALLQKLQ